MATFVIVHGAFGGGWEWTPVAALLRRLDHEVFTPTLTGYGDRHHLGPRVGLSTNVDDVIALLQFEDLQDVVLCGASFGGMAITAAADRVSDRIALLVYIDALIPRDGQSGLDLLPAAFGDTVRSSPDEYGHGWVQVPSAIRPPTGLIEEQVRSHYDTRLRPQPVATFTEPIQISGAVESLTRAFIRCTASAIDLADPIEPFAAMARNAGWPYRELPLPHDPHLFDPSSTAATLHELATSLSAPKVGHS
jgi:pimeloyl-ACP methyl ester carboxylesterase